jgi:hypothetical protein
MKTHKALIIGLALTAAISAHAQDIAKLSKTESSYSREYSRKALDFKKVETNYLFCLNSDVPSVVESALGHVTVMRIAYPKQDLRKIQEKVSDLALLGPTASIRQKASMAMKVFANPFGFRNAITDGQANGDGLLESLIAQR